MNIREIESIAKTGDCFACIGHKPDSFFSFMTRRMALSDYVHAGVLYWEGRTLMVAEMRIKGEYSDTTGYVVEPLETRMKTLAKQYAATDLVRFTNHHATEKDIIECLDQFNDKDYGWLKAFPIAFNIRSLSAKAVCSTVCEKVWELMQGVNSKEAWHPADVRRNGKLVTQII